MQICRVQEKSGSASQKAGASESKKGAMKKLPCLHFDEPCGIQVGAGVVALVQGADDDTAGGAGVDELPVAQVDAHVADTAAAGGKEHQVAGARSSVVTPRHI